MILSLPACQEQPQRIADAALEPATLDAAANPEPRDAAPDVDGAGGPDAGAPPDASITAAPVPPERAALCARPADDAVRDIFCRGERLTVSSLRELEARLGLDVLPAEMSES
ncbi:MAG TPA: hypothetical protein VFZ61_26225, partial [Polyangiales bacterium]